MRKAILTFFWKIEVLMWGEDETYTLEEVLSK